MASFSGLTGRNVYTNSDGETCHRAGHPVSSSTRRPATRQAYPLIFVRGSAPAEDGVVDARRAKINLSGTAVRVGVRYRF